MKRIISILTVAAMVFSLVACNSNDAQNETTTETTEVTMETEENINLSALEGDELTEAMKQLSYTSRGNTYRLMNKLSAMTSGEEVTIAYLGGSITEGLNAKGENCYAERSYNWIAQKYGTGGNVKYVNAGMSGTPSILGNLRVQRDVLEHNADIVFLEFAVNDGGEAIYQKSYESLIRTILNQPNEPAVILLFTILENGHTCQPWMETLGSYYELPMISVGDALTPAFEAGKMTWDDYSDDGSHPHKEGHEFVSGLIENYFEMEEFYSSQQTSYTMPSEPIVGNDYEKCNFA